MNYEIVFLLTIFTTLCSLWHMVVNMPCFMFAIIYHNMCKWDFSQIMERLINTQKIWSIVENWTNPNSFWSDDRAVLICVGPVIIKRTKKQILRSSWSTQWRLAYNSSMILLIKSWSKNTYKDLNFACHKFWLENLPFPSFSLPYLYPLPFLDIS